MKILIIHSEYKQAGGEDAVVKAETELLSANGNDVQLLLFSNKRWSLVKYALLPFNPASYRRVRKAIRSFRPDVIHIHNLHFAGSHSVIHAIRSLKVPMVVTLHNFRLLCPSGTLFNKGEIYLESLQQNFPWHAVQQKVYNNSYGHTFWLATNMWLSRKTRLWNKVDRFITLTDNARNIFASSGLRVNTDKFIIKQNFVSAGSENFQPARTTEFLFVGRLTIEKGVHVLLNAFRSTSLKLCIIGDGPLREIVEAAANASENIRYPGPRDNASVRKEMATCSALIFPSIWLEGMPVTIIEAFATGTPVIASDMGAMKSMITDGVNGFHFHAADENDLLQQVQRWNALPVSCKETFYANCRKTYCDHYTPDENYRQLTAIYESVIQNNEKD